VADQLKVDPVALHNGSNDMFDSVGEAALEFVGHEDGLAEAAPGCLTVPSSTGSAPSTVAILHPMAPLSQIAPWRQNRLGGITTDT
jgi:hypothetical protein